MEVKHQLGLFMDITQFEELEKKVVGLLDRQEKVIAENTELKKQVGSLEVQVQKLSKENEKLASQAQDLSKNQRDINKEEQIRHKVVDLLQKLEGL